MALDLMGCAMRFRDLLPTVKLRVKALLDGLKRNRYIRRVPPETKLWIEGMSPSAANGNLDLVAIAFNNPMAVRHQIRLVRKYLGDIHVHCVADNSNDDAASKEIADLCRDAGVAYVKLPVNPYQDIGGGSRSHACALDWMVKNYIGRSKSRYFGFLDHDIFPSQPYSIASHLERQPLYGHLQERGGIWYLWPGFCFFDRAAIDIGALDFSPSELQGTDTGGSNWAVYQKIDRTALSFPSHDYKTIYEGADVQNNSIEIIDGWIHTFNLSGWKAVADGRMGFVDDYLSKL